MSILKLKNSQGNWISVPTLKGDKGNGIQSAILNDDYTLTLTFTDGTTYKTPSIRGNKGEKGDKGDTGEVTQAEFDELSGEVSDLKEDLSDVNAELADVRVGVDGVTYNSAGAAVRGQISNLKSDVNTALEYLSVNPINKALTMTDGRYVNLNGQITVNENNQLAISDYIPLPIGTYKIVVTNRAGLSVIMYNVNFYTFEKTWISGTNTMVLSAEDIPTGTAFIVVNDLDTQSIPVHDQCSITFSAFEINLEVDALKTAMDNLESEMAVNDSTINVDYFVDKTVVKSVNIDYTTGGAVSNANFAACDYIEVEPNTAYYVMRDNFKHNSAGNIAFYDGSKTYISGQGSNWTTWTTPANCKYVRFSNYISPWTQDSFTWDGVYVVKGSAASALCNTALFENTRYSILNGKKWACIGDSLTEVNNRADLRYWDYIIQPNNMEFLNYGVGGTGYINRQNESKAFYQRAVNIDNDADIITIFGGVNDCLLSTADMGEPTDSGTTTWCGCVNAVIDEIRSKYLFTPLGIISPLPCSWTGSGSANPVQLPNDPTCKMSLFVDKLKEICMLRGVPFLDLFHQSNMLPENADFNAKYYSCYDARTGDGLHPNSDGHKLFYRKIERFIETLLAE